MSSYLYFGKTVTHLRIHPSSSTVFGIFNASIKIDRKHIFWTCFFPGVTIPEPFVRFFNLQGRETKYRTIIKYVTR